MISIYSWNEDRGYTNKEHVISKLSFTKPNPYTTTRYTHTNTHTHVIQSERLHLSPSKAWARTLLRFIRIFH